jgi:hypothetical protein
MAQVQDACFGAFAPASMTRGRRPIKTSDRPVAISAEIRIDVAPLSSGSTAPF